MTNALAYPPGSYLAVRGLPEGWQAVLAVRGHVLYRARFDTRTEAFAAAEQVAERIGLPCLVRRAAQ